MIRIMVVGGTSGLGLELSKIFAVHSIMASTFISVTATGRHDPGYSHFSYEELDLVSPNLRRNLNHLIRGSTGQINLLVYAAGYYQAKPIDKLTDSEIQDMCTVGLEAPAMILNTILGNQDKLPGLIYISSTSAWKPRPNEPLYAAVKAGAEQLVRSVSESGRVGKTLIAAPGGLKNTNFYTGTERDTSAFLDPEWVAKQIVDYFITKDFTFECIDILNDPPHVIERKERERLGS